MPQPRSFRGELRAFGAACALLIGMGMLSGPARAQEAAPQQAAPAATAAPQQPDATAPAAPAADTPAAPVAAVPPEDDPNDPLEGFNRDMFSVNEAVDEYALRPVAKAYRWALPDFAQTGIRNVLWNLRSPLTLANKLLQADFDGAGVAVGRFLINSTVGLGGLIDVAGDHGLPYEYESLDQTFAVWGIPEGFYLVVPLLGPSTLRDAAGIGLEAWADPVSRYLDNTHADWAMYTRGAVTVVDTRAQYLDALDDLKRNSVDYYAAMRSLYRQRQNSLIHNGKPDPAQAPEIPDYDDKPAK